MLHRIIKLTLIVASSFFSTVSFALCKPVDLRDPVNAPLQSQFFKDEHGVLRESQACQSYVAVNLLSQILKTAVSAEDIFFYGSLQQGIGYNEMDGSELAEEHMFFDGGGYSDDFIRFNISKGFCPKADIDQYLQTYAPTSNAFEYFYAESTRKKVSILDLIAMVDVPCKERIKVNSIKTIRKEVRYPYEKAEFLAEADALLEQGQMVGYGHNSHLVTIVGRTETCEYIIQDSIPETQWLQNQPFSAIQFEKGIQKIHFDGGFQYWAPETLKAHLTSITYIER